MADRVEINDQGVRELLKSAEMQKILEEQAHQILSRCGSGYSTDTKVMGTRVIASVYTDTSDAMQDQLENNTLLKAMK